MFECVCLDVKVGPTSRLHKFLQMHMHWGVDDSKGSEHSVDGEYYSAEVILLNNIFECQ